MFGAARKNISSCLPSGPAHGICIPLFFESQYSLTMDLNSSCRSLAKAVLVGSSEPRLRGFGEGFCSFASVSASASVCADIADND
jgi:hypothetical protein